MGFVDQDYPRIPTRQPLNSRSIAQSAPQPPFSLEALPRCNSPNSPWLQYRSIGARATIMIRAAPVIVRSANHRHPNLIVRSSPLENEFPSLPWLREQSIATGSNSFVVPRIQREQRLGRVGTGSDTYVTADFPCLVRVIDRRELRKNGQGGSQNLLLQLCIQQSYLAFPDPNSVARGKIAGRLGAFDVPVDQTCSSIVRVCVSGGDNSPEMGCMDQQTFTREVVNRMSARSGTHLGLGSAPFKTEISDQKLQGFASGIFPLNIS